MPQAQLFDYFLIAFLMPFPILAWCFTYFTIRHVITSIKDGRKYGL